TPQKISERLVSEEVQALLRHLELDVTRQRFAQLALAGLPLPPSLFVRADRLLAQLQVAFLDQTLDELVQQLFELRAAELPRVLREHLLNVALGEFAHLEQGLEERLP